MTRRSSFLARFSTGLGSLLGIGVLAIFTGALIAATCLPAVFLAKQAANTAEDALHTLPSDLNLLPLSQKTTIYAKSKGKNVAIASFYQQDRTILKYDQLTKTVINATLAAEDIRYYQHGGADPQSLTRAALKQGSGGGGGSTIAMQYVKNVCVQQAELLSTKAAVSAAYKKCVAVTYARKLSDIKNAIGLEKKYSKNDILAAYLNIVPFGGRVYGIEAAAQHYYGVSAAKLTPAQAASLIAIVNDPGALRIDVPANVKANTARRDYILKRELTYKLLSAADYKAATDSKVKPNIKNQTVGCMKTTVAGFFCDYVVNQLLTDPAFGATAGKRYLNLQTAGWQVYTTLNLDLQKSAQATMSRYVPKTSPSFNVGGAATSIQVGTGRILAMVQNKTYNNTSKTKKSETSVNYNAGYNAGGFQPGSTYKLFTLLKWLQSGRSLYQSVNGNPRTISASDFTHCGTTYQGQAWQVHNDEPGEGGYRTVQNGTQGSVNGVFASMATQLDLCQIRELAQKFGVDATDGQPLKDNPPSVIGGASAVAPMMMTNAYATVANNGVYCAPLAIDSIKTLAGKKVDVPGPDCHRVIQKSVTTDAKVALRSVITSGTMGGDQTSDGYYEIGKTGTTDSAEATWAIGSTKKVTTGVWVGNVSGHGNLRLINGMPYCPLKGSTNAALERHCVWRGIQTKANSIYGG